MKWVRHGLTRVWIGIIAAIAIILVVFGAWFMAGEKELPPVQEATSAGQQTVKTKANVQWAGLTLAQKKILAPLEPEWNQMKAAQKKKWLKIAQKLDSMSPEEKERGQERIREWAKLTPEQRRVARQNFINAKKLNPQEKSEQWEEYQKLPEEKKKELASRGKSKKRVINPGTNAQKKPKTDTSTHPLPAETGGNSAKPTKNDDENVVPASDRNDRDVPYYLR